MLILLMDWTVKIGIEYIQCSNLALVEKHEINQRLFLKPTKKSCLLDWIMIAVNDNKDELDKLLISHKLRKISDIILIDHYLN